MNLFQSESDKYTKEQLSAREAQRLAEYIAWGPVIFQVSRLMVKWGVLEALRDSIDGLTLDELKAKTSLSEYALKILLEASLSAGTILIDKDTDRYTISKAGWFLLNDPATRVNIDFNHDVNYRGMFFLDEALKEGKPAGLVTIRLIKLWKSFSVSGQSISWMLVEIRAVLLYVVCNMTQMSM